MCGACEVGKYGFPECPGDLKIFIHVYLQQKLAKLSNLWIISDCACRPYGSTSTSCNQAGECYCKPNIQGAKCDTCKENTFGIDTVIAAFTNGSNFDLDCQGNEKFGF